VSRRLVPINSGVLLDGVLPTPKIREIKISYSSYPPKVSNPHIDHQREAIIYEDRGGLRQKKHPGFTIKKDPRNLLIEVSVVLTDKIQDNGQSKWVMQQDLLKYMNLQLVHCEDPEFSKMLRTRAVDPTPAEIRRRMKNDGRVKMQIEPLGGIEDLKGFYGDETPEPGMKELVLKFNFAVNTTTPEHLTYFANVFLDVEKLINDYSLDLTNEMLFSSCGDTAVEAVYNAGRRVDTARIYTVASSGGTYAGRVYRVGSNHYVAADVLNDDMIRRDLLDIVSRTTATPGTTSDKYKRQMLKVVQRDSDSETKMQQITKMLAGWKARSTATQSGAIYREVMALKEGYMKSVEQSTKIEARNVPNITINDVRTIEQLTEIPPEQPVDLPAEQLVEDVRSKDYNYTGTSVAGNIQNAKYFSNCMVTRDSTSSARLAFFLDWRRLAFENSSHRALLERATEDVRQLLFSRINMASMRIIRERVDEKDTLSQFDNHMLRDRESIVEVVATAFDNPKENQGMRGTRSAPTRTSSDKKFIGSVNEVKISGITSNSLRAFEAFDNAITNRRAGKFRYRVEISFLDKIGNLVYDKVLELRAAKEELLRYYNMCLMPCNYDIDNEKLTEFFISGLYKKYRLPNPDVVMNMSTQEQNMLLAGANPLDAPWLTTVAKYVDLLRIYKALPVSTATDLAKKMHIQLEPKTATPDSILSIIKKFEELEETILKSLFASRQETAGYSTDGSKVSQKLTKTHRISYQFSDVYDNKTLPNVGTRYLQYGVESRFGLAKITKNDFIKRLSEEESRFFTSTPAASQTAIQDMATYRFSYLAPSHIRVGGKKLQLLNRGEALYTPEQYKDILLNIASLQSNPAARPMTMPVVSWPMGPTVQSSDTDVATAQLNMSAITLLANFGISISPPTPFLIKKKITADPMVEVATVLGENTLLAIQNAVEVGAESGESTEIVTDLANAQLSIADMTSFATSLVSTLTATGLQKFTATESPFSQVSTTSVEALEQISLSKTLEFFDITNPRNGIDTLATKKTGPQAASKTRKIPNQIKSLFLSKTPKVAARKNWHQSELDPIASPDTRPLFEILYFNLQKVEVLKGFRSSKTEKSLLRAPVYELLREDHLSGGGKLLCRMSRYRDDTLQIGQSTLLDLPVYNKFFIVDLDAPSNLDQNPVVEENLYTSGGEYQTLDGTNYIGSYHIHKDKTVMTGAAMNVGESRLLPATVVTTEENAASSKMVKTLASGRSKINPFQKAILTDLVSNTQTLKNVVPDFCVTVDTIQANDSVKVKLKPGVEF